ncbi:MAG: hypothetical protein GY754_11900 [bacterium]|nr:hypothetical protein [bacterium]
MKNIIAVFFVLLLGVTFCSEAFAKQGLSVGFGAGLMGDCGDLGKTILDDGLTIDSLAGAADHSVDAAGTNILVMDKVIFIPDEQALTDQSKAGTITDLSTGGVMMGLDLGLQIRYDLSYFFVRTGFNYTMKVYGGETSWKKSGVDQEQEWSYTHWSIPVTLGINIPVLEGKVNMYLGATAAYMSGGFDIKLKRTYLDSASGQNGALLTAGLTALGSLDETGEFRTSGIAFGYVLGVDAEVVEDVSLFIEIESLVVAAIDTYSVQNTTIKAKNPTLSYTAIVGGSFLRFGAKYHVL